MAGLNVIGLFVPAWNEECLKRGETGMANTCAELQAIEDAAKAEAKAKEEAAKKAVAPAFTGTPTTVPSTTTAIYNSASRFKGCEVLFRGPGGAARCQ